jgi:hypothetical protein
MRKVSKIKNTTRRYSKTKAHKDCNIYSIIEICSTQILNLNYVLTTI